jgi:hypothetical protein
MFTRVPAAKAPSGKAARARDARPDSVRVHEPEEALAPARFSWSPGKILLWPPPDDGLPYSGGAGKPGSERHLESLPLPMQAKLEVGAVDDPLEREADRAAAQVMSTPRGPVTAIHPDASDSSPKAHIEKPAGSGHPALLHRNPSPPQILRLSSSAPGAKEAPPIVHEILRSPGRRLDAATRSFFEPRFGYDFSRVRIHADAEAAESARAVRALAYTVGDRIAFAPGRYAPHTHAGRKLLSHELAHVVQQGRGGRRVQRAPADTSGEPAPPGFTKAYQYTVGGKTVTLTEQQYKAEVARATKSLQAGFRDVLDRGSGFRMAHEDFIENIHGEHWYSVGSLSDIEGETRMPPTSIWYRPFPAIRAGRAALERGDLAAAARMLPVAQDALNNSIREWHAYIKATGKGAEIAMEDIQTIADVSFQIAIGYAAIAYLPFVAGSGSSFATSLGATGATHTALTGAFTAATIGSGAGAAEGLLRGGASITGQALRGEPISGAEALKTANRASMHGAGTALSTLAGGVAGGAVGRGLGPASTFVGKVVRSVVSSGAGGGVGAAVQATMEGKSPGQVGVATAEGTAAGGLLGPFAAGAGGGAASSAETETLPGKSSPGSTPRPAGPEPVPIPEGGASAEAMGGGGEQAAAPPRKAPVGFKLPHQEGAEPTPASPASRRRIGFQPASAKSEPPADPQAEPPQSRQVAGFGRKLEQRPTTPRDPHGHDTQMPPARAMPSSGKQPPVNKPLTWDRPGTPAKASAGGKPPAGDEPHGGSVKTAAGAEGGDTAKIAPEDLARVKQLDEWIRKGVVKRGEVAKVRKNLQSADEATVEHARVEFDANKEAIEAGESHGWERHGDLPRTETISTGEKSELENSAWLKKRLPNPDDRREFMGWLKQGHKEGDVGAEIPQGQKVTEKHQHYRPGAPETEAKVREWEEMRGPGRRR